MTASGGRYNELERVVNNRVHRNVVQVCPDMRIASLTHPSGRRYNTSLGKVASSRRLAYAGVITSPHILRCRSVCTGLLTASARLWRLPDALGQAPFRHNGNNTLQYNVLKVILPFLPDNNKSNSTFAGLHLHEISIRKYKVPTRHSRVYCEF